MKELFLRVLTVSLTCSAVLFPLLLLGKKLRGRYAAKTLYFLWLLLALRLVLPLPLTLPQAPVTVSLPSYTVKIPARPPVAPSVPTNPSGGVSNPPAFTEPQRAATQSAEVLEIAAVLWQAGIAVFLIWQIGSYLMTRRRFLRGTRRAAEYMEGVAVYRSLCACTPVAMGLLRPVIFLPAQGMDAESEAVALSHERCHIARHDLWYKAFFLLVNAIHWFNPIVWLFAREAGRNLELCCDDEVLRKADGPARKRYGQVLLNTAAEGACPALSTRFGSGKGQLKERLQNLFQKKKRSRALVCVALAAALLLGGLVACETKGTEESKAKTLYATFDVMAQAEGTDYETVKLAVVDYDPESGTVGEESEEQRFLMADDVLCCREEGGNTLSPGKKGTGDRKRELVDFFFWPALRSTVSPGQSDLIELVLNEAGEVAQMTWRRVPEIRVDDTLYESDAYRFTLALPESWAGKYSVRDDGGVVTFYQTSAMEEGDTTRGILMSLCVTTRADFDGLYGDKDLAGIYEGGGPKITILGDTGERLLYLHLDPTPMEGADEEFRQMHEDALTLTAEAFHDMETAASTVYPPLPEQAAVPAVDRTDLDACVGDAIMITNWERDPIPRIDFPVVSHVTLKTEESGDTATVYAMARYCEFLVADGDFEVTRGSNMPVAITFRRDAQGRYALEDYWEPTSGEGYPSSIRERFPTDISMDEVDTQRHILAQQQAVYAQVIERGNIDAAAKVEALLEIICASPAEASSPGAYIAAHDTEYQELTYYGDYARDYCFARFEEGGQTDLRGAVMAALCRELLGMDTDWTGNSGQEWYDTYTAGT